MSAERHLNPVDLETGEITCPRCEHLKPGDVENLEKENRRLMRKVHQLEADKDEERRSYRERKKVLAMIELWANLTGHPKANINAADRFDMVRARRKENYPFECPEDDPKPSIEDAIYGLAAFPYVTVRGRAKEGKPSERHDRMGIALGSGEDLERFARLGYKERLNGV